MALLGHVMEAAAEQQYHDESAPVLRKALCKAAGMPDDSEASALEAMKVMPARLFVQYVCLVVTRLAP